MSKSEIETRLDAVERELAELRALVRCGGRARPWYKPLLGSMDDYPEFEEVVRLGRELRVAMTDPYDAAE